MYNVLKPILNDMVATVCGTTQNLTGKAGYPGRPGGHGPPKYLSQKGLATK